MTGLTLGRLWFADQFMGWLPITCYRTGRHCRRAAYYRDTEEHPDLLWGLRGGGGNLALLFLEYRLHPLTTVIWFVALSSGAVQSSVTPF